MAPTVDKSSGAWAFSATGTSGGWVGGLKLTCTYWDCKVDKSISRYSS
jgi:hypothetical protein